MKAFKGFNKDLKCRNFQYEEGKEYTYDGEISICSSGFHFCEYPLDCFIFYRPSNQTVFHEVEIPDDAVVDKNYDRSKSCANKIKIGKRLSIKGMMMAAFKCLKINSKHPPIYTTPYDSYNVSANFYDYSISECNSVSGGIAANTGKESFSLSIESCNQISATTNYRSCSFTSSSFSVAASAGINSISMSDRMKSASVTSAILGTSITEGANSISACCHDESYALSESTRSISAVTGFESKAVNEGSFGIAASTSLDSASVVSENGVAVALGDDSISVAKEEGSHAISTGFRGIAVASAPGSVAMSLGVDGIVRGVKGSYLVLSQNTSHVKSKNVVMRKVDGKKIKANTWYGISDEGHFIEAPDMVRYYCNRKLESVS